MTRTGFAGVFDRGAVRDAGIVGAGVLVMAAVIVLSLRLGREADIMTLLPLGLVAAVVGGWVFLLACAGEVWAMLAFLMALVFVNDALFRVRDPGEIGMDWQNMMKFGLWAGAGAIGACTLPRSLPLLRGGAMGWLMAYLGYAMLSSLYSAAPLFSFATAFGFISMGLFAAALATVASEKQIMLAFVLSLLAFILVGWVAYFALPDIGRSLFITDHGTVVERMCGLAGQPNALGNGLAVYIGLVFLLWYRGHIGPVAAAILGGMGLFTLLVADSRTALIAVVAGIVAVVLRRSVWLWGSALLGSSVLAVLGFSVQLRDLMSLSGGLSRSGDPAELFTLTGRTEIWSFAWEKIVLSPWIGYGYNSSKFILPDFDGLPGLKVDEAHNMLLQNLLAVGVIGTIPLLLMIVTMLTDFVRAPDARRDLFTFLMIIWGVTVAGAFGSTPTVLSLAIFCVLALVRRDTVPFAADAAQRRPAAAIMHPG